MKNAFLRWATATMTPSEVADRAERQAEVTERIAEQAAADGDPQAASAAKMTAGMQRAAVREIRKAGQQ